MQNQINYLRALITKRLENMEERGASAVEYGLLVACIAAVIVAVVVLLGGHIKSAFTKTDNCIASNGSAASCS